ncbi:hypothetical protein CJJ23_04290 [Mycoplasmopsis agassizii]|uniref:Uncharacterized protein n=1 Tax=Mycoplasmopsis agassizii TaxID=33922 RepID=A0A269TJD3_9BACT|nr:hypothetical protein [Mycoplasmopsis agassizii]PAK20998.1 hypothetical protein CJJ23_04290 [Mycoplasmopsis agassizii]
MLPLHTQLYRKIKKMLMITSVISISTISLTLASCSQHVFLKKGAAIYSKETEIGKKPYVQINLYGYPYFTFSNWYPAFYDEETFHLRKVKTWTKEEIEKTNGIQNSGTKNNVDTNDKTENKNKWGYFIRKYKWTYKNSEIYNMLNEKQRDEIFALGLSEQKNEPSSQKYISLIKNSTELKSSLRLEENDQNEYREYFKKLLSEDEVKKNKDSTNYIKNKFEPWSTTFNFETINNKLDFDKYDYLFVKDESVFFKNGDEIEIWLSGGIQLRDYKINLDQKKIYLGYDIAPSAPKKYGKKTLGFYLNSLPDRLNSFFIPIEKNKLTQFVIDDWTLGNF